MATNPIQRQILRTMVTRGIRVKLDNGLYEVSPQGREALFVSFVAERWLQGAPGGPLDFDGPQAEAAILALAEGWQATLIHALAPGPLDFKQLTEAVEGVRRGRVRRLLAALRSVGLVETEPGNGEGAVYAVTDWLRAGLAPLIAAARVERRQGFEEAAPIDALDVEAAFHLALPLLELPKELTGVCRLGVNLDDEGRTSLTGVTAEIDQGRIVTCRPGLEGPADAWANGPAPDWLDTVIEPDAKRVRVGGDKWLPAALLRNLHETLFGIRLT
jgi:DNA-binding HxlR family transcriptional regulator